MIERIEGSVAVGYDHLLLQQIGPDQDRFLGWFKRKIAPAAKSGPAWLGEGRDLASSV